MLEVGTRVKVLDVAEKMTGVITARYGEKAHYKPSCPDYTLFYNYEVKIDGVEEVLDEDGYYENYILTNKVERIYEKPTKFTKQDLISGDVIELRNGKYMVFISKKMGFIGLNNHVFDDVNEEAENSAIYCFINDNFKHYQGDSDYDVTAVYRTTEEITGYITKSLDKFEVVYKEKENNNE